MGDEALVARVKRLVQPLIDAVAPSTSVPPAFLGALTCNETGAYLIHTTVVPSRFEPHIYNELVDVQQGLKPNYGSITTLMLVGLTDDDIKARASSWGLTQIMGYETLAWGVPLSDLINAATHYKYTVRLLAAFAKEFNLDVTQDFEAMFRCWNGGHPTANTFDPQYVPNGLNRMALWDATQVDTGLTAD